MPFDGITTYHLINELSSILTMGRIRKIFQPESDEIRLVINRGKDNYDLLLSANANNPRVYITTKNKVNPTTPPNFCMVLRKHLMNGIVSEITQHETDRVIEISVIVKNEFNDLVTKKLIVEVMGRNSNIILIDNLKLGEEPAALILDCLKRVGISSNRYRQLLPGRNYIYPPENDRISYLLMDFDTLKKEMEKSRELSVQSFFMQRFLGISPLIVEEICFRCGVESKLPLKEFGVKQTHFIIQSFLEIIDEVKTIPSAKIYFFKRDIFDFSTINLRHLTDCSSENYPTVSDLLESYYFIKDKKLRFKTKSANIRHQLETLLKKSYKKQQNLHQDLLFSQKNEKWRLYGDLITANMFQLSKGLTMAELPNYMDPEYKSVEIPLKINETPSQNAQRYYKKYNKAKRALNLLEEQLDIVKDQIYYIESLLNGIEQSTELNELDEIRDEFVHSDLNKKQPATKSKLYKASKTKPFHYVSSENFDIFVGKNNYQNDYISTKLGSEEDCWLHVKDIPGSHVLVIANGRFITEATLLEAGVLAAYYSKSRNSENVPVDYVAYKDLKKPKKSKPGMVVFTNQNTMFVTPTKDSVKSLTLIED